ncbi:MAG: deoxyribonuclease IV [Selenomonas sp.]|uniref:deoxyribonuclease IV n=1 Tax=Selenomonas sp. TaxID=2053611 RepID=UPI0025E254CC|nr:deoxyribonuclease IV [Selenomonas sp.]MCR5758234.1 deoxyribonuclease IV [Selenomonas sp.]
MLHIGCHLSSTKGYLAMGKEAARIGADTFAFFTRNPRGGKAKEIDAQDVQAFLEFAATQHFVKLVAHAPYTMNLCSAKENIRTFAQEMLADDLQRMEYTPGNFYNLHPGSHVGQGVSTGSKQIATVLNQSMFPTQTTTVLLETMAGKGTEIGRSFAELQGIIEQLELKDKVGVCLDTCHVWDGGYDIVNNLEAVLAEFDRIIGLDRLKAIHLNDSQNPCGAHKDRHARIGEGCIGLEALTRVINHPALRELPFILETPNDLAGYAWEIALLRANQQSSFPAI